MTGRKIGKHWAVSFYFFRCARVNRPQDVRVFCRSYFTPVMHLYLLKTFLRASSMQPPKSVVYESLLAVARSYNALYKMGHIYFFILSASFLPWSALSHLSALVSRRPLCMSRFLNSRVELRLVDVHSLPPSVRRGAS